MRLLRFLVGLSSLLVCILLSGGIVLHFIGIESNHVDIAWPILLIALLALTFPFAFLAFFISKKVPHTRISAAIFLFIIFLCSSMLSEYLINRNLDLKMMGIRDETSLRLFVQTVINSPMGLLISFYGRALSMILIGLSLRPVKALDPGIRSLRTLLILAGLSSASLVLAPLSIIFIALAYGSLGFFLMGTRIGPEPKFDLKILDDYYPSSSL